MDDLAEAIRSLPVDQWRCQAEAITPWQVEKALSRDFPEPEDYLTLLSPAAADYLEPMAAKANRLTTAHFGRTMQIYTPLYLANYCDNRCLYCSFNHENNIKREKLTVIEAAAAGRHLQDLGFRHLLLLTGSSRKHTPPEYIAECARAIRPGLGSLGVEIYAMEEPEYRLLEQSGVDTLTIYQETYDPDLYGLLHPAGPKKDYARRLETPAKGCAAGLREVNMGALLGLGDWRYDAYWSGIHAWMIQKEFPQTEVSVSFPRLREFSGSWKGGQAVTDAQLVQAITALRLFLPRAGITISTREAPDLRENLIPLGPTRMSAGSSTYVGGGAGGGIGESENDAGSKKTKTAQFAISDNRDLKNFCRALKNRGYQPVLKDWENLRTDSPASAALTARSREHKSGGQHDCAANS